MAKRTVTIDLRKLTDAPWKKGDKVRFVLRRNSFTLDATYPASSHEATVDEAGRASAELWCNAEGMREVQYVCELPGDQSFPFTLPPGDGPVSVEVLRGLSAVPFTPSSEAAFQALLNTHAGRVASADDLGHVRIGAGLEVDDDGRVSVSAAYATRAELDSGLAAVRDLYVLTVTEDTVLNIGAASRALILIDTSESDVRVTMQPVAVMAGRELTFKKLADENLAIVDADGDELIDRSPVFNLEMLNQVLRVIPAGGQWWIG